MSPARIQRRGDDRLVISGELSFATVAAVRREAADLFDELERLDIDLHEVDRADSAGLALLVDWMREARQRRKSIQFLNIPGQMLAIARVSSLDQILPLARG